MCGRFALQASGLGPEGGCNWSVAALPSLANAVASEMVCLAHSRVVMWLSAWTWLPVHHLDVCPPPRLCSPLPPPPARRVAITRVAHSCRTLVSLRLSSSTLVVTWSFRHLAPQCQQHCTVFCVCIASLHPLLCLYCHHSTVFCVNFAPSSVSVCALWSFTLATSLRLSRQRPRAVRRQLMVR